MVSIISRKGLLTLSLMLVLVLAGCGAKSGGSIVEGKVNVVTTFYPIYEFTQEIGGADIHVINRRLVGGEPHDWTPRSQDMINTSKAQLYISNGAGLAGWVITFWKGLESWSKGASSNTCMSDMERTLSVGMFANSLIEAMGSLFRFSSVR